MLLVISMCIFNAILMFLMFKRSRQPVTLSLVGTEGPQNADDTRCLVRHRLGVVDFEARCLIGNHESVTIGVIDAYMPKHHALKGLISHGSDTDYSTNHGTHVAGTIKNICPDAQIVGYLGAGSTDDSLLEDALNKAVEVFVK